MSNIQQTSKDNSSIIFDPQIFAAPYLAIFEGQYWQDSQSLLGTATGRGTTYFFQHNNGEFVLRHYRRGGLIGRLIDDQYLFTSLEKTRAWREFHLLAHLHKLGLPAPEPVAAKVTRMGLLYRADIIIKRIAASQDVFSLLSHSDLTLNIWRAIGRCIRQFHHHNIYHHDLNIHNIMLDEQQKVWLIDFDKCYVRSGKSWQLSNLARLKRSLDKELNRQPIFHYNPLAWQALLDGYAS